MQSTRMRREVEDKVFHFEVHRFNGAARACARFQRCTIFIYSPPVDFFWSS